MSRGHCVPHHAPSRTRRSCSPCGLWPRRTQTAHQPLPLHHQPEAPGSRAHCQLPGVRSLTQGHWHWAGPLPPPTPLSPPSWHRGGRLIRVRGTGLDTVWQPLLSVWLEAEAEVKALRDPSPRRSCGMPAADPQACVQLPGGLLQVRPSPHQHWLGCSPGCAPGHGAWLTGLPPPQCSTVCSVNSSSLLLCRSPAVPDRARLKRVFFSLDNVHVDFASASGGQDFQYQPNPRLAPLSREGLSRPYRLKPGHVLDVEVSALSTRGLGYGTEFDAAQASRASRARASTWASARRRCTCTSAMASAW